MPVSDLFDMLDAFIPTNNEDESDDDNDTGNKVSSNKNKESHMSLWKRANLVVKVLIREKRKDEATRCILAFFRDFEDLDELENVVKEIENLVTRPTDQKESEKVEVSSSSLPDSSS